MSSYVVCLYVVWWMVIVYDTHWRSILMSIQSVDMICQRDKGCWSLGIFLHKTRVLLSKFDWRGERTTWGEKSYHELFLFHLLIPLNIRFFLSFLCIEWVEQKMLEIWDSICFILFTVKLSNNWWILFKRLRGFDNFITIN